MIDKVEGIDYTPSGIRSIIAALVELRDKYLLNWAQGNAVAENINVTVILTHSIALLHYLEELEEEEEQREQGQLEG
jgi:hypothetical protein